MCRGGYLTVITVINMSPLLLHGMKQEELVNPWRHTTSKVTSPLSATVSTISSYPNWRPSMCGSVVIKTKKISGTGVMEEDGCLVAGEHINQAMERESRTILSSITNPHLEAGATGTWMQSVDSSVSTEIQVSNKIIILQFFNWLQPNNSNSSIVLKNMKL